MTLLPCRWTGDAFEPMRGHRGRADADLVVGQVYLVETVEERSAASHRQYFAALNEIWQSLPDSFAAQFPTVEHMRKRGLVETGYRDETSVVCSSAAEARRMAAFMRPIDEFAAIAVNGAALVRWTAKSQSMKAMGKETFQRSKEAVLDWCGALLEADVERHGNRVRGSQVAGAKLAESEIKTIRKRAENGERYTKIAKDFGVSISTISLIKLGKIWTHVA